MRWWLGHFGPAVIRGRLSFVSPFVCSSASCSSASVVLRNSLLPFLCHLCLVFVWPSLCYTVLCLCLGFVFVRVFVFSFSCLLFSCLVLPCLVLSCFALYCLAVSLSWLCLFPCLCPCRCPCLCPCLLVSSCLVLILCCVVLYCLCVLFSCPVLSLSCLVCSLCCLGGRVGSFFVVLGVLLGHFSSS